jgi:hypothetical protein
MSKLIIMIFPACSIILRDGKNKFILKGYDIMLKNKRKFLPVFLTIALVVCLFSGFSSAAAVDTYTVSIYVQEAVRNENGGIDSTYVWVDTPIQVTVTSGETLKDAIDDAATQAGSPISAPSWVSGQYLEALTIDAVGDPYENIDTFSYDDPAPGYATYEGLSWMYFLGGPDDMPASSYSYPSVSLGNYTVNQNTAITLSYEYLIYIWQY